MTPPAPDTRTALLDAATGLFAHRGFDGTSVREITRLAGANLGAITYHFGSKAALFEEVVHRAMGELVDALVATTRVRGTPLERIERAFTTHFTFLAEHPALRGLAVQVMTRDEGIPERARVPLRLLVERMAGLIAEGQRDGTIRAGDPRVLTIAVMAPSLVLNLMRGPVRAGPGIDLDQVDQRPAVLKALLAYLRGGLVGGEE